MRTWNRCFPSILALVLASASNAATISIVPELTNASVGEVFSVEVWTAGLGDGNAPSIGAYEITLRFDGALLAIAGVTQGGALDLGGLGSEQSLSVFEDRVRITERSADSAAQLETSQDPSFRLATILFEALAVGVTPLVLAIDGLFDGSGAALAAEAIDGRVGVGVAAAPAIPEPGTALLLGAGLLAVAGARRGIRAASPRRRRAR